MSIYRGLQVPVKTPSRQAQTTQSRVAVLLIWRSGNQDRSNKMQRALWKRGDLQKHAVLKQAQFTLHINNPRFGQTTTDPNRSKDD